MDPNSCLLTETGIFSVALAMNIYCGRKRGGGSHLSFRTHLPFCKSKSKQQAFAFDPHNGKLAKKLTTVLFH